MIKTWFLALIFCASAFGESKAVSPTYSPFFYIADYVQNHNENIQGYPEFYFNEGYLNFKQNYYIDTSLPQTFTNTNYIKKAKNINITSELFGKINAIKNANTHIVAYHSDFIDGFNEFSNIDKKNIFINSNLYKTHGKNMQASNGRVWFSQTGSLNLQTVGETCKANNAIVFIETKPILYNYFKGLWNTVYNDYADTEIFKDGTSNSTGIKATKSVDIDDRSVSFYGGKADGFVGNTSLSIEEFPHNLRPPVKNELPQTTNGQADLSIVNWFDLIIYDSALLAMQGKTVQIDIVMFEIGQSNQFVNNLYRFIKNGFENNATIYKSRHEPDLETAFPGRIEANLYYQFQAPCKQITQTCELLDNGGIKSGKYALNTFKVWQNFTAMGQNEPKTPQDMHHKFAILSYQDSNGQKIYSKLYVTTSNLDEANVGSGKKWQSGVTITAKSNNDALFKFYDTMLQNVLLGQQMASVNDMSGYFDKNVEPNQTITKPGIAAFAFPLYIIKDKK